MQKYPSASLDKRLYEPVRQIDTNAVEQLTKCTWIDEGKNLTVTGKTGTGKIYLVCAVQRFYNVKYIKANKLLNELSAAKLEGKIIDYHNQIMTYDLLIIDDFGFMSLKADDCLNLFEILDNRATVKSTIVSSQLLRATWYDLFQDCTYAEDACMDRMLKGAYKIEIDGPGLRGQHSV